MHQNAHLWDLVKGCAVRGFRLCTSSKDTPKATSIYRNPKRCFTYQAYKIHWGGGRMEITTFFKTQILKKDFQGELQTIPSVFCHANRNISASFKWWHYSCFFSLICNSVYQMTKNRHEKLQMTYTHKLLKLIENRVRRDSLVLKSKWFHIRVPFLTPKSFFQVLY